MIGPARIRTWSLLIRSQTRYPLRHKALQSFVFYIKRYELKITEQNIETDVHDILSLFIARSLSIPRDVQFNVIRLSLKIRVLLSRLYYPVFTT